MNRLWLIGAMVAVVLPSASAESVTVMGEVLDGESKAPVAGVRVELRVPGAVRAEGETDASGAFVLEADSCSPIFHLRVAESEAYREAVAPGVAPGEAVTIYVERHTLALVGTLTDRVTGRGVPFTLVDLGREGVLLGTARTDERGRYEIPLEGVLHEDSGHGHTRLEDLWVTHRSDAHLPATSREVRLSDLSPWRLECDLAVTPNSGVVRIECISGITGQPIRNTRVRIAGVLGHGWTERVTDGAGAIVVRAPAWRRGDLPFEENHLRDDLNVTSNDPRFGYVRVDHITVTPGVSETPGVLVTLALVPVERVNHARSSTASVIRLDPGRVSVASDRGDSQD